MMLRHLLQVNGVKARSILPHVSTWPDLHRLIFTFDGAPAADLTSSMAETRQTFVAVQIAVTFH